MDLKIEIFHICLFKDLLLILQGCHKLRSVLTVPPTVLDRVIGRLPSLTDLALLLNNDAHDLGVIDAKCPHLTRLHIGNGSDQKQRIGATRMTRVFSGCTSLRVCCK